MAFHCILGRLIFSYTTYTADLFLVGVKMSEFVWSFVLWYLVCTAREKGEVNTISTILHLIWTQPSSMMLGWPLLEVHRQSTRALVFKSPQWHWLCGSTIDHGTCRCCCCSGVRWGHTLLMAAAGV